MDPYVRRFIRSSLLWFGFGVTLGAAMALWPQALAYRTAHLHANLLGFVSMMIFGVAYHVLPRFSGRPLHSPLLASLHLWIANTGLGLLVTGWLLRPHTVLSLPLISGGGLVAAAGAFCFIYNIWRTLEPQPVHAGQPVAALRPNPMVRP